jgi:SAM-dependent methyltransferase
MSIQNILEEVNKYYTDKVNTFGATPKGVDWNGEESQQLRFKELLKIIDPSRGHFSVLDYGCGYGSLFEYMKTLFSDFKYTGFDISDEMIAAAKKLYSGSNCNWIASSEPEERYEYVVASGIFNVRMQTSDVEWKDYILNTLQKMNDIATKGFSFNVLTSYSDKEYMREYLYYADPTFFFDYCKRHFSKYIALLHDYPLYEFTIHVKK